MRFFGVVEGFYWMDHDAIDGRVGEYSTLGRIRLFETMSMLNREYGVDLNTYLYDPKYFRKRNNMAALQDMLNGDMDETIRQAAANQIRFVFGLAPGHSSHWNYGDIFRRADYVKQRGGDIALLFDDTGGAAREDQMVRQAELANLLNEHCGLLGICSGAYVGDLQTRLRALYQCLDPRIPIIHVGLDGWNRAMDKMHLHEFGGHPNIIWDNWMAADSSEPRRLEFQPPKNRTKGFVAETYGYLLNLCFPEERIVHMIASLSHFKTRDMEKTVEIMGQVWSRYLDVEYEVIHKILRRKTLKENVQLSPLEKNQFEYWPSMQPFL